MGLFSGQKLSQVRLVGDTIYPKYGLYWNRIDRVKQGETRLQIKHIVIEYTVIRVLPHQEPPPSHVVGEEACHYIEVTGNEYAAADWAGFITGIFGCKVEELDSPDVKAICGGRDFDDWATNEDPAKGEVQPMLGMIGEMKNRMIMTKDKPGNPSHPFTKTRWVRAVPMAEVFKVLTPDEAKRFFPASAPAVK